MPTESELLRKNSLERSLIDELEAQLRLKHEELDRTTQILDRVLRQMPAIYWMIDRDFRVVRNGGAIEQILGYPAELWIGKTLMEVVRNDPSSNDTVASHARALAGEIVQYESTYRGKVLATTLGPFRNSAGEIIGALGNTVDVTTPRELERRMVDTQRAESLGIMASGLAHDFNNLLVAVLGNADLALREVATGQTGRSAIENIRIAGLRAAELTDQLLAFAGRGGAGTTRVEPGLLVEELLRIVAPSIPATIRIKVEIPDRLAVRGDPAQLRQVFLNLINNARDAIDGRAGSISITAEAQHVSGNDDPDDILTAPPGRYIAIRVSDNGPGMSGETRRHVFEPFFTTKQTGHGLGLAAVLGIVRAHGGGIRVKSAEGGGAQFIVLWPAAVTAPISAPTPPRLSSRTVLVIDDEALVRDVVARMVEDLGYAAVTAADGPSGLEMIDRGAVDAVLVDLTMPMMSGADVLAAVRVKRPDLPVVVCSGYDRDGRGPVQADAYLPKPFRMDALERTLAKLLPLRSV